MSSELTIDIQLTELGFTSWDFQLLKQKETPQTCSSPSALEANAAPSPSTSVETFVSVGHSVPVSPDASDSNKVSQMNSDKIQNNPTAVHTGNECDDEDDKQVKEDGNGEIPEEQRDAGTDDNYEIDVDINDEEEDEADDLTEEEEDDVYSSDMNDSEDHRCHVCDVTFSKPFLLREHMHIHTGVRPYRCAECGKQFCHLANYRAHLRSHDNSCLICSARFATQQLLKNHLDTNHFEKEFYQCDFCKRIFVSMDECEKHVQEHKQEVKRYPCPQCDRTFQHRPSLHRHIKWHEKSALICTDCGQAFAKKISLLRHSFIHLGLLPYTCVHCKRHFRLASLYQKHECKPQHIQCVACLVVFQSQDDFRKHKKDTGCWGHQMTSPAKMNDIRCMECGQTFDSSEKLKKHAGTHQRVMKCSECGMGFRSTLMLMSHMTGHAYQRPFLCKECGLGFPHQQAYDGHLKTCGSVTPSEVSIKKPKLKAPSPPKKKEINVAPTTKVVHIVTPGHHNQISQGLPLHSLSSVSNQKKPSEGPWTLVLNKEHLAGPVPLVMLLPPPITSSDCIQNPQNLISSSQMSGKHLPLSHATLASTSEVAKPDESFLVQSIPNSPTGNILVPLPTTANNSKMQWTILDQCTSGSVSNMQTMTSESEKVVFNQSAQ